MNLDSQARPYVVVQDTNHYHDADHFVQLMQLMHTCAGLYKVQWICLEVYAGLCTKKLHGYIVCNSKWYFKNAHRLLGQDFPQQRYYQWVNKQRKRGALWRIADIEEPIRPKSIVLKEYTRLADFYVTADPTREGLSLLRFSVSLGDWSAFRRVVQFTQEFCPNCYTRCYREHVDVCMPVADFRGFLTPEFDAEWSERYTANPEPPAFKAMIHPFKHYGAKFP